MFKKSTQAAESSTGVPTFMGLSGNRLVAAITATATVGFLLFGYGGERFAHCYAPLNRFTDQGVMSGIITADQFAEVFPRVSADYQERNNFQGDPSGADEYASLIQATYTSIVSVFKPN